MSAATTIKEYLSYSLLPPNYRVFQGISLPIFNLVDTVDVL